MNTIFIDIIGYLALLTNLYSMSSNGEYRLRLISVIANFMYIIYGFLINALPIMIGCTIAIILHSYHLRKLTKANK